MILGLIPAAGNGNRWGGFSKEMLPVKEGCWLIDHTAQAMLNGGAEAVVVVASEAKIGFLARHLATRSDGTPLFFAVQRGNQDMWSAIQEGLGFPAERWLFAMPDTYYPRDAFENIPDAPFGMGIFDTHRPERFGTLRDGQVINKQGRSDRGPYSAWGLLTWDASCVEAWERQGLTLSTYTDAINLAIARYGLHTWPLAYYHDFARLEDYEQWLLAGKRT